MNPAGATAARGKSPRVASFEPVAAPDARLLLLGSMPGVRSLQAGEYYAHPRNSFWRIMAQLLGFDAAAPYEARLRALQRSGIALWDVLHSCERSGSLDTAIDAASARPNDFAGFLQRYPRIDTLCFNGAAAQRYFNRRVAPTLEPRRALRRLRLPSSSPAHAALPFEAKLQAWRAGLGL